MISSLIFGWLRVLSVLSARRDWSVRALDDVRERSFDHNFCLSEPRRVPEIIALRHTVSAFAFLLRITVLICHSKLHIVLSVLCTVTYARGAGKVDFSRMDRLHRL